MSNDILLQSSTIDLNVEKPMITDHQSLLFHENDSIIPVSQNHDQKPSSSYLTLSVGDNAQFGLSNFQDPLFYQEPLHFHYNHLIPSTSGLEHEKGDRVRFATEIKFSKDRKRKPISSHKHQIEKSRSTHRQPINLKKSKDKMAKVRKKTKKRSTRRVNVQKQKNTKSNRNNIHQLRYQFKTRQELLRKHRRQQEMLLKKKKRVLKQRIVSKKRSMTKRKRNNSSTSTHHNRKINITNNRMASKISPGRSLKSRVKRTGSINQSKTETTVIKQQSPMLSNVLSSTFLHSTLSPKTSSNIRCEQKLSKKNLHSRSNVTKFVKPKSKQRNRGDVKLNIRSSIHTTLKKNVRRCGKRRLAGRKIKFSRCTSKTLVTMSPTKINDRNMIKSTDLNNENIYTRTSPSLFSLQNSLIDKLSSASTVIPLTKNSAQLTSKNNNRRVLKIKRQRSNSTSSTLRRKSRESTRKGMTLRSRTIIINDSKSTERKNKTCK